ncbi:hypothetical protein OG819_42920 [Streptomyces sp. NBC_01549]|uniref:hypothetical protein n=1 Tax=Streptomyces sp. NBC_01549 TaxID=2975874 RepID=UPI0022503334|nr:hypothetical protein [Streptomyces sp. NBC_01549]MCX4596171.1 hypothetical protein [Streptomyces sp. NBC_01549]
MTRRKPEPVDPATLPPPAVIARQIEADLAKALHEIRAVARSLEGPPPETPDGQLALDL